MKHTTKNKPKTGAELSIANAKRLGYSPTQATASGAGTHGGGKRDRRRRDRRQAKHELR